MGTMDDGNDEIRFDFRDPSNSDGDETDSEDESDSHSPSLEEVDSEEDEEFQLCGHDRRVYAINTESRDPHMAGETIECKNTYSYVQAMDLEKTLQAGMSLLEGQQREEGTSWEHEVMSSGPGPGSTSKVSDPHNSLALQLGEDLGQVLSRFTNEKGRAEVFQAGAATSVELPGVEKIKADPEKPDETRKVEKLPIRKRIIIKWNGGKETAKLEWTPAGPHEHSVTARPDERLQQHTVLVDPAVSTETKDPVARSGISQKGIIVDRVVQYVEEDNTADSHIERITGQPDETGMSLHPETPVVRTEAFQMEMLGREHEEEKSTVTHPLTVTGPRDGNSAMGVLSRRQRGQARLWNSEQNERSCVCSKCGIQKNILAEGYICNICSDEQRNFSLLDPVWVSPRELKVIKLENSIFPLEPDLSFQIYTQPRCFQGYRAILLKLPNGNILWDCLTYIDEETVVEIAKKGGLKTIAISSPDRIGACARMSYIFNRCLIYIHTSGRGFLTREAGKSVRKFWAEATQYLGDGVTLIHLGGHFPGSCILHLDHKGGIVFSSNTLKVGADRKSVSVMLHCDNYIPASPDVVRRILHIMEGLEFDELWGDKPGEEILEQAKPRVISSLKRYILWTQHDEDAIDFATRPLTRRELIARGKRKVHEI